MPHNCGNFRMIGISGDQNKIAGSGVFFHDPVDLRHKGTGGIDIGISSLFQLVIDRSTDAVGTDHHAFVRLEICDAVHNACSAAGEIVHHVLIVDNGPQRCHMGVAVPRA